MPPHPFFIALQFLTVLPVSLKRLPTDRAMGRSLLYYPLIGALIGGFLITFAALASLIPISPFLTAALLLALWVLLTGGLHLDGLADSADALAGSHKTEAGSREKALAIMKDPASGPMGVIALVLVLLLKFAAFGEIIAAGNGHSILIAPVIGRTLLIALFLTTPYIRPKGLGAAMARTLPRPWGWMIMLVTTTALAAVFQLDLIAPLIASLVVFALVRALMLQRLGGMTGDPAGALVELAETAALIALVLCSLK